MPVYDCNDAATVAEVWPSRVLDANGKEIEWVFWCDTDTGLVGRQVNGPDGQPVLNADETAIGAVWEYHPAPLRLVKIEPSEMETVAR